MSQLNARFGRWWLREFLALFPERVAQWLTGSGKIALVLAQDDAFVELRLRSSGGAQLASMRVTRGEYTAASIDDFLRHNKLTRFDVTIAVVLRPEQFYTRKLVLPRQAGNVVDGIVARDLAEKTPFRLENIYYDYAIVQEADKLTVTQQLAKRDSVEAAAIAFGIEVSDIAFLDAATQQEDAAREPAITLRRDRNDRTFWARRMALALAGSAVALTLTAGGIDYWRQQSALDTLGPQIANARRQAQEVRDAFAKLEHRQNSFGHLLARKRHTPALLDIWNEVTRLVPSDSWLTELHVTDASPSQDHRLAVSGFSAAAAKLVVTFDRSPLFREAALTTAIALDSTEQRERFALQAMVRSDAMGNATP
ncbi:MAG TPA: PilN domain-containing protein [Xanthobacteraceae bacterium]|nr:PilN domain-containing protein [Xanthobacteraceae bacterium]